MKRLALLLATALLLAGCDDADPKPEATSGPPDISPSTAPSTSPPTGVARFPNTAKGVRDLVTALRADDGRELVRELRATKVDYEAIYQGNRAGAAEHVYENKVWKEGPPTIKPKPGQTDVLVFSFTASDIRAWTPAEEARFHSHFKAAAEAMTGDVTVHLWIYVEPGKAEGTKYEGLFHVNGHWVWLPKPWRPFVQGLPESLE